MLMNQSPLQNGGSFWHAILQESSWRAWMNAQEGFIAQAAISGCSFNKEHEPISHSYEKIFQTWKIVHFTNSMFSFYP